MLMTMTEAAERKGCSREWIYYLIKKGRLKAKMIGGIYILKQKDVDACEVGSRSKASGNGHTSSVSPKRRAGKKARPGKSRLKGSG